MARWRAATSKAEGLLLDINYLRHAIERRESKEQMRSQEQVRAKKMLRMVFRRRLTRTLKLASREREAKVKGK